MDVPIRRRIIRMILARHLRHRGSPCAPHLLQLRITAEAGVFHHLGHGRLLVATLHGQNRKEPLPVPVTLGDRAGRGHLPSMTRALILAALVAPLMLAGAAQAQTAPRPAPLPAAPSTWDQHRHQADQHRYEMDRLRQQNEQRQATARQLELQTRQNQFDLQNRRTVDPYVPSAPPALRSPEEERAARQAATERRETTSQRVGEIDAWLDRRPN